MKGYAIAGKGVMGWVEKEKPEAAGIDAVVRPIMISPCTSDVHNVEAGFRGPGLILGHEGVAEVVQVGGGVKDFKPGDIVAVPPVTPNWRTLPSQKGVPQHCSGLMSGNALSNTIDGLMAEFAIVPDADMNLAHVPQGVDLASAVMVTDMMNTGFYGAELADIQFGDTVAVLGIGPVGLMAALGAVLRGAARIIAIGSRPVCVQAAKFYGATDIVNYKDGDITKQVFEMTAKQGADKCVIAGGDDNAVSQAVSMVRPGGTVGNVSYFTTTGNLSFSNPRWGFGMGDKTIRGGLVKGGRARLEALLSMLRYKRVDLLPLITHRFHGLSGIAPAFDMMAGKPPDLIKTLVEL